MTFEPSEFEGPIVRDKRRIDPDTGEVREPRAATAPASDPGPASYVGAEVPTEAAGSERIAELETELAERTSDLQRLQAEYVNYKRRVDRDREVVRQSTIAGVVKQLLPVIDDIGRARDHDELHGGFKLVAESFEKTLAGLGLTPYGEVGDPFDPHLHEALMHSYSDEVDGPVCQAILQVGYRLGDRIIRPARVAVAEPEDYVPPVQPDEAEPEAQAEMPTEPTELAEPTGQAAPTEPSPHAPYDEWTGDGATGEER